MLSISARKSWARRNRAAEEEPQAQAKTREKMRGRQKALSEAQGRSGAGLCQGHRCQQQARSTLTTEVGKGSRAEPARFRVSLQWCYLLQARVTQK